MTEPSNFRLRWLAAFLVLMVLVNAALVVVLLIPGLRPLPAGGASTPTQAPTAALPSPSATAVPTTFTVQAPPTGAPTASPAHPGEGLIFLSISDGDFRHLYAYHPQTTPLTRLSGGDWDDIHPASSPDGSLLAYSSRQNGYWDIYTLNMLSGEKTRLLDTPDYDGAPTWSPDAKWLAYESLQNGHLQVKILSLLDPNQPPLELTSADADSYSPSWSPQGREIAFISNRNGKEELWLARLDRVDDRFISVGATSLQRNINYPRWSPDGRYLAWTADSSESRTAYVWDTQTPQGSPRALGSADLIAWKPDGSALLAVLQSPNQTLLTAYNLAEGILLLPALIMPGSVTGLDWNAGQVLDILSHLPVDINALQSTPTARGSSASPVGSRASLVPLVDVNVPTPYLHEQVSASFTALRRKVAQECGWDFLANLDNAYIPLTTPTYPGLQMSWLYTGRGFSINTGPLAAGWLVLLREDFSGLTYWRVLLRARAQDGSQGLPLRMKTWDLNARFKGSPQAYENGGELAAPPSGYWVDFTELALRYGWERLPAHSNWRNFYPAGMFDLFVNRQGLDWQTAMLQLYPPEAITTPTPILTLTSTLTPSLTPWYNWMITPSATATASPTPTRRPTYTPRP